MAGSSRPESESTTASVSPAAVARLSEALLSWREALESCPATDAEKWRGAIGVLCNVARQERFPPERFLVHFKRVLDDVDGLQSIPGEGSQTLRSRLITLAIECYFESR